MTDIVERLRARDEKLYDSSKCGNPDHLLLVEAADEIERLREALRWIQKQGNGAIGPFTATAQQLSDAAYTALRPRERNRPMTDIVERLRECGNALDLKTYEGKLMKEASDEIERLRVQKDAARKEIENAAELYNETQVEIERLRLKCCEES